MRRVGYACDLEENEWHIRCIAAPIWDHIGVVNASLSVTGGLVFFGDDAEAFEAVDVQAGKPLWHLNTGQGFSASPMSYAIQGKQYVAIAAGSDIFSFSLP